MRVNADDRAMGLDLVAHAEAAYSSGTGTEEVSPTFDLQALKGRSLLKGRDLKKEEFLAVSSSRRTYATKSVPVTRSIASAA